MLKAMFSNYVTHQALVQAKISTNSSTGISESWEDVKTVECLFYRGGIGQRLINAKLAPDVTAVALIDPSDLSAHKIPKNSRVIIFDNSYALINNASYNIGSQSVIIDSINDSKSPIKKGDTFTLESYGTVYTITSTVQTNGVTTTLNFTPGLANAIVDDHRLTIKQFIGTYTIFYPDDIGEQGEVLMLPLTQFV